MRRLLALMAWAGFVQSVKKAKPSSLFQTFAAPPMPYPYAFYPPPFPPQYYQPQGFEPQMYPYPPMYMPPQQMYMSPYPQQPMMPVPPFQQGFSQPPSPPAPIVERSVEKPRPQEQVQDPLFDFTPKTFFSPIEHVKPEKKEPISTTQSPMHVVLANALDEANKDIDKASQHENDFASFDNIKFSTPTPFTAPVSLSDASVPIDNHILNWRELVGLPSNPLTEDQRRNSNDVMKPLLPGVAA